MDYQNINANDFGIDESVSEIVALENKLLSSSVPSGLKEEGIQSINRLKRMVRMGGYSNEFETVGKYIDWIVRILGETIHQITLIFTKQKIMDSTHF